MNDEPMKRSVTVRIAGEDHAIRSAVDPEHTRRCAELVEERVRDVRDTAGFVDTHRAVILAALSIADGYLKATSELEEVKRDTVGRAGELLRRIEESLGSDPLADGREPASDLDGS